jgi:EthD domain
VLYRGPVEKIVYVLIGDPGASGRDLGRALRTEAAAALRLRGARRLQVNVVDPALGPPFGVPPEPGTTQLAAAISMWVNTSEGFDALPQLPDGGPQCGWFGYLVCESEPRPNTTAAPGPEGRVPGFAQLMLLGRQEGLGWGEWRRIWQGSHTSVALATQSSFRYVQNVIFRPLTPGAPSYAALAEECFPLAAASDLEVFFDAVGDEARLARHMAALSESCDRFMDDNSPVAWTAEYLIPDQ